MRRRTLMALAAAALASPALGASPAPDFTFASIDGGDLSLSAFRGGPVLVVNTASRCGFTPQYEALQALHARYRDAGLTVVGVPSDSFRQELDSAEAVKDFCEVNFGIDFPMTDVTPVTGGDAHPFYRWAEANGVRPSWNFHKILLNGEGQIAGSFGTPVRPDAPEIIAAVEALLPRR